MNTNNVESQDIDLDKIKKKVVIRFIVFTLSFSILLSFLEYVIWGGRNEILDILFIIFIGFLIYFYIDFKILSSAKCPFCGSIYFPEKLFTISSLEKIVKKTNNCKCCGKHASVKLNIKSE